MPRPTLLGFLAGRFVTQRENLATEALCYILQGSSNARRAFIAILSQAGAKLPADLVFRTQAAAADQVIPDLVGEDEHRRQLLIVEAKFWAGLTDAQPVAYLNRLLSNSTGVLVFIAPLMRLDILWSELTRRFVAAQQPVRGFSAPMVQARAATFDPGVQLITISWRAVLEAITHALELAGEVQLLGDARQLSGLCEREDAEAFLPLESEELTGTVGHRIIQFEDLVDDIADRLVQAGIADMRGLRAAASKGWYGKYMRIAAHTGLLHFSAWKWGPLSATPLWLRVTGPDVRPHLFGQPGKQWLLIRTRQRRSHQSRSRDVPASRRAPVAVYKHRGASTSESSSA